MLAITLTLVIYAIAIVLVLILAEANNHRIDKSVRQPHNCVIVKNSLLPVSLLVTH